MTVEQKEWLTMKEAAAHIGVSYERFTKAVKSGEIPVSKVPGFKRRYIVSKSRLDEVMRQNETHPKD